MFRETNSTQYYISNEKIIFLTLFKNLLQFRFLAVIFIITQIVDMLLNLSCSLALTLHFILPLSGRRWRSGCQSSPATLWGTWSLGLLFSSSINPVLPDSQAYGDYSAFPSHFPVGTGITDECTCCCIQCYVCFVDSKQVLTLVWRALFTQNYHPQHRRNLF